MKQLLDRKRQQDQAVERLLSNLSAAGSSCHQSLQLLNVADAARTDEEQRRDEKPVSSRPPEQTAGRGWNGEPDARNVGELESGRAQSIRQTRMDSSGSGSTIPREHVLQTSPPPEFNIYDEDLYVDVQPPEMRKIQSSPSKESGDDIIPVGKVGGAIDLFQKGPSSASGDVRSPKRKPYENVTDASLKRRLHENVTNATESSEIYENVQLPRQKPLPYEDVSPVRRQSTEAYEDTVVGPKWKRKPYENATKPGQERLSVADQSSTSSQQQARPPSPAPPPSHSVLPIQG